MAKYVLLESRDPFDSGDTLHDYQVASDLAKAGNEVTLFLVQNGVFPARKSAHSERLSQLAKENVTVLADSFALRERAIASGELVDGVKAAELEVVVDAMAAGHKTIWL